MYVLNKHRPVVTEPPPDSLKLEAERALAGGFIKLTEDEKRACKMLSLSEVDYLAAKMSEF